MSNTEEPVRWLHLSDFHVGKDLSGQQRLFKDLLAHIESKIQEDGAAPDLIFFTGDIADRGKAEQYSLFYEYFFWPLAELLELSVPVFFIPGNHDVDREATTAWRRTYLNDYPDALDDTQTGQKHRTDLAKRFRAYSEAEIHELTYIKGDWINSQQGAYHLCLPVKNYKIGIVGLNTAWLCGDDQDQGHLSPGSSNVARELEEIQDCELRVVLGHHQLDWFLEQESRAIRARFGQHRILYLHGDQHRNWIHLEEGAGQPFLVMEAGATFQERNSEQWANRLLWCNVYPRSHYIDIQPRIWSTDNQQWAIDSSSIPDNKRVKAQSDWYFRYDLPGAPPSSPAPPPLTPKVPAREKRLSRPNTELAEVKRQLPDQLPAGWELLNKEFLPQRRQNVDLKKEEIIRYFDGRNPRLRDVLEPHLIPHREIVGQLVGKVQEACQKGLSVNVLLGGGGEGKSTALLQAVCELLETRTVNYVIWHSNSLSSMNLSAEYLQALPKDQGQWLIVTDDAETIVQETFAIISQLYHKGRKDLHFLLCCRDSDWSGIGADKLSWRSTTDYFDDQTRLAGLSWEDAQAIIAAWRKNDAMGTLSDLPDEEAIQRLVDHARIEAAQSEGSFLGAMLRTRIGDPRSQAMYEHVQALLTRLETRDAQNKNGNLLRAYAYSAILHAENATLPAEKQSLITEDILAHALGIKVEELQSKILRPLGQEAAISSNWTGKKTIGQSNKKCILIRHTAIAETAVDLLCEGPNPTYSFDQVYETLFKSTLNYYSADTMGRELRIPRSIMTGWRRLPDHFMDIHRQELGFELARIAVEIEKSDSSHVIRLASFFLDDGQPEEAVEVYRTTFSQLAKKRKDSLYYNKWATAEGKANNFALSIWLDGIGIDDDIGLASTSTASEEYTREDRYKLALKGMLYDFPELARQAERAGNSSEKEIFLRAWNATIQLGIALPWRSKSRARDPRSHFIESERKAKQAGVRRDVPMLEAITQLQQGIEKAWQRREDELQEVKPGNQLYFEAFGHCFNNL